MFTTGFVPFNEETLKALSKAARLDASGADGRREAQRRNMAAFEAAQAAASQSYLDLFEDQIRKLRVELDAAASAIEALSPDGDETKRAAIHGRAYLAAIEGAQTLSAAAVEARDEALTTVVRTAAAMTRS